MRILSSFLFSADRSRTIYPSPVWR
uniref:Uncharacterized protein n=1 Tax=Arundo donax TaxID=35708 RepID=A0A0A9BYB5_ARUDO